MDYANLRQQIPFLEWSSQLPETSAELVSLINSHDSMTRQLKRLSNSQHLSVQVISETLNNQGLWEREVLLKVDGNTCIWAQSQIPSHLREQPLAHRPLGEWLFTHYHVTRSHIDYATILYGSLKLPIRRSHLLPTKPRSLSREADVATRDVEQAVLVIECFLPCISNLLRENTS